MKWPLLFFVLPCFCLSQETRHIDSINGLYVQGLNMPQDSLVSLFMKNLREAEKVNYELGMADAYSQLSLVYGYQGKYEESTKNALEGIKRSEDHTSELQSRPHLVCRLLLEQKKRYIREGRLDL